MLHIQENKDLSSLSTFRLKGTARYFAQITDKSDIADAYAFAESHAIPVVIIGGGSNTIFAEPQLEALVLQIAIPGFEQVGDASPTTTIFRFGAGEVWDSVVERTVALGYSGIEALSAIPGFVGGTPVQNVGAYGQEVSSTIMSLEAYDTALGGFVTFMNEDCRFQYRDSYFKGEGKGRYVIVSVDFLLSKNKPEIPKYPGVAEYFTRHNITDPTLLDIRNAIIEIRKTKLPDPKEIASVGSFFKNPFIPAEQGLILKAKFEKAVIFPVDESTVKVGAGWMLETDRKSTRLNSSHSRASRMPSSA